MPIRIGVSPRAWMMKGEATCSAPSAAAPFRRLRRSNVGLRIDGFMSFSRCCFSFLIARNGATTIQYFSAVDCFASLATTVSSLTARLYKGSGRSVVHGSSRPLNLAAGGLGRSCGFLVGHGVLTRQAIVRLCLGRGGHPER